MRPGFLPINEIYGPVLQGEGPVIGLPSIMVRTAGCDYRCSWCDTPFAVLPGFKATAMTADEIVGRVQELSRGKPVLVTLTGGNPALQDLDELITLLHRNEFPVLCETQGSIEAEWFQHLDFLVLSPKPPSSGMDQKTFCTGPVGPDRCVKVAVDPDRPEDLAWLIEIHRVSDANGLQFIIQPVSTGEGVEQMLAANRKLTAWVLAQNWHNVRVLPQLQALLYGRERGR